MLYFDRIDVSEWIDVNKTSKSKEHDNCHYFQIKASNINQMSAVDVMIY